MSTPEYELPSDGLDPLGDAENAGASEKNFARVGSARPSTLLYTYGPGAIMDLPNFSVMPGGLDDLGRIWSRRPNPPSIDAPRLLDAVRRQLASSVQELRPHPWQPKKSSFGPEGEDLGIAARVFPQWFRCPQCDLLASLASGSFSYVNSIRSQPYEAKFHHVGCPGPSHRRNEPGAAAETRRRRPRAVTVRPAPYLLACTSGHLDEFPYQEWVHARGACTSREAPTLRMTESAAGKGSNAVISCDGCGATRRISEAQGKSGEKYLPVCRGRLPHLGSFDPHGCENQTQLMLMGSSNLWFPVSQSVIVMPMVKAERDQRLADRIRQENESVLEVLASSMDIARRILVPSILSPDVTDAEISHLLDLARQPAGAVEHEAPTSFDQNRLLRPEWEHLENDPPQPHHRHQASGLTVTRQEPPQRPSGIDRVLAVETLRKVNALIGFTRVDDLDRIVGEPERVVRISASPRPTWTLATEDRGEGVFLTLDEGRVHAWEQRVLKDADGPWPAYEAANERNFTNRFSNSQTLLAPQTRLRPPRYWLLHTLSHVLIREMAMTCGYAAASLSERIYAWSDDGGRPAAGLMICTTAADSDGTLGGLVRLSDPALLQDILLRGLRRAMRCSSDPICATRLPRGNEDFLHGAACHCCSMVSETSCERANRFLDRRFLVPLVGSEQYAYFGDIDAR